MSLIQRAKSQWAQLSWAPLFALFISFLVIYPIVELIRPPISNFWELLQEAIEMPRLGAILWRTTWLACGSMTLATLIALVLAWCRSNLFGRWGATAQIVAMVPLVIPPLAGVTGWAFLFSPNVGYLNVALRELPFFTDIMEGPFDVYTLPWIIGITAIYLIPYAFVFIQAGLANIDPRLEDAARTSGSSWWGVQCRIVLPLLRPSLIYGGSVVALLALGQFTAPLLLGRSKGIDVITTQLYRLTGTTPTNFPLAELIALPVLLLALVGVVVQRKLLGNQNRFSMASKGIGRGRSQNRWLLLPIALYCFLLVIPPLIGLLLVAGTPFWGAPIGTSWEWTAFTEVFSSQLMKQAIFNSLQYSLIATCICIVICLCTALVTLRTTGRVKVILDFVINLPIAIPAILFGMGVFVTYALGPITLWFKSVTGYPLYGSGIIIILSYVILVLPHGTRLVMSGMTQIDPKLETAAMVFGSSQTGSVIRILVPLLRRNLVGSAMLMFILCSHEFAASVLLIGPETQVMSTVLYGQWDTGTYPQVAALALIMVAIALVGLAVIAVFDGDRIGYRRKGSIAKFFSRRQSVELS